MDIKDFKAGSFQKGYEYIYFLPEKINHSFFWTEPSINELLDKIRRIKLIFQACS